MYYCPDCGKEFEKPERIAEKHGFKEPPYEVYLVCPKCKSTAFYPKNTTHCRCCGARLTDGKTEFCSQECRQKGMLLRKEQIKQKLLNSNGPLTAYVRETEIQNKRYGTNFSYGQYVSLLTITEKRKCNFKRRKNS